VQQPTTRQARALPSRLWRLIPLQRAVDYDKKPKVRRESGNARGELGREHDAKAARLEVAPDTGHALGPLAAVRQASSREAPSPPSHPVRRQVKEHS